MTTLGPMDETVAATFCATLVDEWIRCGVRAAFVAPGSRSTPLALALADRTELRIEVFHDERAAAFAALGWGLATNTPGVVLCSSGTAGAHFYAAVIEADLSAVPMIVCTADRPPELWDVGAPQVIDQTHLYGDAVRFFAEPGVPTADARDSWRSLAARASAEASGFSGQPGPVHLNLSFADPLAGNPGELPSPRTSEGWHQVSDLAPAHDVGELVQRIVGREGVIIAGEGTSDPGAVIALARRLGWPVLADHLSGCRRPDEAICHFDSLLRAESFAAVAAPQVILRFGRTLASKALSQWIATTASAGAEVVAATARARWSDPERVVSQFVDERGLAVALLERLPADLVPATARETWRSADAAAATAVADALSGLTHMSETQLAREVLASIEPGGALVLASSMPVREVEWWGSARSDIAVYSNRGANGIDGIVSTAIGVASAAVPTTVLIGDVAFLHDQTALIGLADRCVDLTIVVVDNDGGGIFGFLPQHDLVGTERFEQLFGTPHATGISELAGAHRLEVVPWSPTGVGSSGIRLVHVVTDRERNLADHARLHQAVADAIT